MTNNLSNTCRLLYFLSGSVICNRRNLTRLQTASPSLPLRWRRSGRGLFFIRLNQNAQNLLSGSGNAGSGAEDSYST